MGPGPPPCPAAVQLYHPRGSTGRVDSTASLLLAPSRPPRAPIGRGAPVDGTPSLVIRSASCTAGQPRRCRNRLDNGSWRWLRPVLTTLEEILALWHAVRCAACGRPTGDPRPLRSRSTTRRSKHLAGPVGSPSQINNDQAESNRGISPRFVVATRDLARMESYRSHPSLFPDRETPRVPQSADRFHRIPHHRAQDRVVTLTINHPVHAAVTNCFRVPDAM